jgi:hypothetical protein
VGWCVGVCGGGGGGGGGRYLERERIRTEEVKLNRVELNLNFLLKVQ